MIKFTLELALLIIILCASPSAAPGQRRDTAAIDKFISSQESRENGYQAKDIRTVRTGDLNHDGIPDAVVLYTMEAQNGTNNYVQHLAVFVRVKGQLLHAATTPVGGKNNRSIKLTSVKKNVMYFKTLDYAENDPSCCPSIKGSTRYVLDGNKLKELLRK